MLVNNECAVAVRKSQVDAQIGYADDALSRLHDRIEQLSSRLRPILDMRETKSDQKNVPAPEVCLVPLADKLRSAEKSIQHAVDKLETILNSIEL